MQSSSEFLIALIGVFASGIVALLVARKQVKAALRAMDDEYRKKATEKLFNSRLDKYPELHSVLIAFTKKCYALC